MSNPARTHARRDEEIAFLIVERVLGVDISLADAGAGNSAVDGAWIYVNGRRAVIEVTSPPDAEHMRDAARAQHAGELFVESGVVRLGPRKLSARLGELLRQEWAFENMRKLAAQDADERHLFLFGRSHRTAYPFYLLSDQYVDAPAEPVSDLALPEGASDVWFLGRAFHAPESLDFHANVARFNRDTGWSRHSVELEERLLPVPPGFVGEDVIDAATRRVKAR